LPDKELSKYALDNELCLPELTELEVNFLKAPDKYAQELFSFRTSKLEEVNRELALELGNLPDIKELRNKSWDSEKGGDYSQSEIDNIFTWIQAIEVYEDIEALIPIHEQTLSEILNTGIKDKRAYCSPLEGLLWIAKDRDFGQYYNPLKNYSLEALLKEAWGKTSTSNNYQSDRWEEFDEVVKRASFPIGVTLYMNKNIRYDSEKLEEIKKGIGDINYVRKPEEVFEDKQAICSGMSRFALYLLLENGYSYNDFETNENNSACILGARDTSRPSGERGHQVCLFVEDSTFHIINADFKANIQGPFNTVESAADRTFPGWKEYDFRNGNQVTKKVYRK
jgi:hypothetical protein